MARVKAEIDNRSQRMYDNRQLIVKLIKESKDLSIAGHQHVGEFSIYGRGRVITINEYQGDGIEFKISLNPRSLGWTHLFQFKAKKLDIKTIDKYLGLKDFPHKAKFDEWDEDLNDFRTFIKSNRYPFHDYKVLHDVGFDKGLKDYGIIQKETRYEYGKKGKTHFTVVMMPGSKRFAEWSRFRRQPVDDNKNPWGPIYMHGVGGAVSSDYSCDNMFIADIDNWQERLLEVPYLKGIKKMEMVRKSGEIVGFTNTNNKHIYGLDLKVEQDPFIEIRIY